MTQKRQVAFSRPPHSGAVVVRGAMPRDDVYRPPRTVTPAGVFVLMFARAARRGGFTARAVARRLGTILRLTFRLGKFSTLLWVFKLLGLIAYSLILAPAFLRVAWRCVTSRNIELGVVYGDAPRNALDLYFPDDGDEARRQRREAIGRGSVSDARSSPKSSPHEAEAPAARPVVIFITGGMWIIGYKAWGALLAQRLSRRGCIVASLDYRNFPQGTIGDMIADVGCGIGWVLDRIEALGGDGRKVVVIGQSAGAHIAATCLLRQAGWAQSKAHFPNGWSPGAISRFIGISGLYAPDDEALVEHVHRQGLYKNVFWSIMEAGFSGARASEALPRASPVTILREHEVRENVRIIPPVMLCHGESDKSAPPGQSRIFASALRSVGVAVDERYYVGKTHTDPFVTDPILGEYVLLDDITNCIFGRRLPPLDERPLVPRFLVEFARLVVPF